MALYEHMVMSRQDISPQQAEALNDTIKDLIEAGGGIVAKIEYWGLRNLTYRVKKNRKASLFPARHRRPPSAMVEGNGTSAVDQRRRAALADRPRRGTRPGTVARCSPAAIASANVTATHAPSTTQPSKRKDSDHMTDTTSAAPTPRHACRLRRRPAAVPFYRRRKVCPFSG